MSEVTHNRDGKPIEVMRFIPHSGMSLSDPVLDVREEEKRANSTKSDFSTGRAIDAKPGAGA